jgi:hypothetical protein
VAGSRRERRSVRDIARESSIVRPPRAWEVGGARFPAPRGRWHADRSSLSAGHLPPGVRVARATYLSPAREVGETPQAAAMRCRTYLRARDSVSYLPLSGGFGGRPTAQGAGRARILPSRGPCHEKGESLPARRKNRASPHVPTGPREPSPVAHPAPRSRPSRRPARREGEEAQPQDGSGRGSAAAGRRGAEPAQPQDEEPSQRSRRTRSRASAAAGPVREARIRRRGGS